MSAASQYVGLTGLSLAVLLSGCATQAAYVVPAANAAGAALVVKTDAGATEDVETGWWRALDDPAVDALAAKALATSPDIERAVAVIAQARASAATGRAARLPSLGLKAGATSQSVRPESGASTDQSAADVGATLAWEVDLFGRLREGERAGAYWLDGRIAEAKAVRLALIADVAQAVVALRACERSMETVEAEIQSRAAVVALTRLRRDAGLDADIDVALSETGLETARTTLSARRQDCAVLTNTLVLLTGEERAAITRALARSPGQSAPPSTTPRLPAGVLLKSPLVIAAERDAAAAWSDIAVARAARLPRLDLSAALTGQWLSALGSSQDSLLSSIGAGLSLPLFDGGAGAASVTSAEARYAAAVADLDTALRIAARDVENALAASASARSRQVSSGGAVAAAEAALSAREAQWRAGAVSQFEVEEARRQLAAARDSQINATRDVAQAWVALVRAAGPHLLQENPSS